MSRTPAMFGLSLMMVLVSCAGPAERVARKPSAAHDPALAADATADAVHAIRAGEIRAELERYYADFTARDWPALGEHFWPGATITTIWQLPGESVPRVAISSLADFLAQAPNGPGSKAIFEERMTAAETKIQGDLAQVWAKYEARFGDPGAVQEWKGIDAFTLMKFDGRWKIVAVAFASDGPTSSAP